MNSVTVFAKCHHGQTYFPTKAGVQHPALRGRDLLGEQIEALHREGIRCPIYTTVVWEEDAAVKHPEWRQMSKTGHFAGWDPTPGTPPHPWSFLNFLDPDYQDYIEAHVREIFSRYGNAVDGLFLDIVFFAPNACWSETGIRFRARRGLLDDTPANFDRFQGAAQQAFCEKFTKIIRGLKPDASIFYNAHNEGNMYAGVGPRVRTDALTHFEIESLPSGFWGYFHFPRMARMQSHWGKFWLGMTGRFQKMWGDFGGIKPQAALEFECFRSQALGGGNSIGDQLPPRGLLDPAAYDLIGAVYAQCEAAESFYENSSAVLQVGAFSASWPGMDGGKSEEGVVQMCEESHYDVAMLDGLSDLAGLELLILPDTTVITPEVKAKLKTFYEQGGKLILSYNSGLDENGKWALDFLPLTLEGDTEKFPDLLARARGVFTANEPERPGLLPTGPQCARRGGNLRLGRSRAALLQALGHLLLFACPNAAHCAAG